MSKILIPSEQEIYPNPNTHVNFEFDDALEEYRTSRYLNQTLKMFSPDIVLWGLDRKEATRSGDNITLTFNKGNLIQDSTLVKILYEFTQTITCPTNPDYYVIVYTEFKFNPVSSTPTSNPQSFNIKTGIVYNQNVYNGDPNTASQISWDEEKNRIVLYIASADDPYDVKGSVDINGKTYKFRGHQQDKYPFKYDNINCFNVDGGIL